MADHKLLTAVTFIEPNFYQWMVMYTTKAIQPPVKYCFAIFQVYFELLDFISWPMLVLFRSKCTAKVALSLVIAK